MTQKVLATKNETFNFWSFTHGQLTYFGQVAKNGEAPTWRAAYNPKRVIDKLEAISASEKTPEQKASMISTSLKSLTSPTALTFEVQLGGTLEEEVASKEEVTTETTPAAPLAKKIGKFPKKIKEIKDNE